MPVPSEQKSNSKNTAVCPESTLESAVRRNYVQKPESNQNKGCESTIESAPRRDFIRKAALVTAAAGVGGVLLGKNSIPVSHAACCFTAPDLQATHCVAVDSCLKNNGSGLSPGLHFGGFGSGEGIASPRVCCPKSPNLYGLDFYTGRSKHMSITNCGNVLIGNICLSPGPPGCTLDVRGGIIARGSVKAVGLNGGVVCGTAVYGSTCFGDAVYGISHCGNGVHGRASHGYGIYGQSCCGPAAVFAKSFSGIGVCACSVPGPGVRGTSAMGIGAEGIANSPCGSAIGVHGLISSTSPGSYSAGVRGENNGTGGSGIGVYGSQNGSGWGVYGIAPSGVGVFGCSPGGVGVSGSGKSSGVNGTADSGKGIAGFTLTGTGVFGAACGSGGVGIEGVAGAPGAIPLIAKGASGQTAPMFEVQKVCGKPLTVIDEYGNLGIAIGGAKPATTLQVGGGMSLRVVTVTANYSMKVSDYAILANAATAALTVTLPHANISGLMAHIKKIDSSAHVVTIAAASGDKIEGVPTKSLSTQYGSYTLIADGVHTWYIQSNAT
jgi:hypothetical protein